MSCFPRRCAETLHPVGRLDKDTEGLLLFTDDGMLDVRLLRPEQHVEKGNTNTAHSGICDDAMRQLETGSFAPSRAAAAAGPRAAACAYESLGKARRICRSASAKNT